MYEPCPAPPDMIAARIAGPVTRVPIPTPRHVPSRVRRATELDCAICARCPAKPMFAIGRHRTYEWGSNPPNATVAGSVGSDSVRSRDQLTELTDVRKREA